MENKKLNFKKLDAASISEIEEMSAMATEIVREHYDPILGTVQNDYMLQMFQSVKAIEGQLQHGYNYYFVRDENGNAGFVAFYPREDCLYLSKFYLYKHCRGRGYSRIMMDFVKQNALDLGCPCVDLNVNKYNSAVAVYEKLGLVRIRDEKNDIGNGYYMDDFVYRLEF